MRHFAELVVFCGILLRGAGYLFDLLFVVFLEVFDNVFFFFFLLVIALSLASRVLFSKIR